MSCEYSVAEAEVRQQYNLCVEKCDFLFQFS